MNISRNLFIIKYIFIAPLSLVWLSCSGGSAGGSGYPGNEPNNVKSIVLSPAASYVNLNEQESYWAQLSGPGIDVSQITWSTNRGSLSVASGQTTAWTAPASSPDKSCWIKATSALNLSVSATSTIILMGVNENIDQDDLKFMDYTFRQNASARPMGDRSVPPLVYQTFKPTYSTITSVSIFVVPTTGYSGGDDIATIKIADKFGIIIGSASTPLLSSYFKWGGNDGYYINRIVYFQFPDNGLSVIPEENYQLSVDTNSYKFLWGIIYGDKYTRGQAYYYNQPVNNTDYLFRIYGK
jgi:hypothetical protein